LTADGCSHKRSTNHCGLIAVIDAAVAGLALIGTGEPPKKAAYSKQTHATKQEDIAQNLASVVPFKAQQVVDTSKKQEPCGQAKYKSSDDLCAQWKAADAAREAADWAWLQMWLSSLGVIGLALTLWFNFRALSIAKDAADETKDAIIIARQSAESAANLVRLSDRNARLELRAYLDFDGVRIDRNPDYDDPQIPLEKGVVLKITIRNYGRTPAQNVESDVTPQVRSARSPTAYSITNGDRKAIHTISPSDCFYLRFHWRLPTAILEKIESAEIQIIIPIIITYTDIFEKPHVLRGDFEGRGIKDDFGVIDDTRVST
jgi:hypothetical protein